MRTTFIITAVATALLSALPAAAQTNGGGGGGGGGSGSGGAGGSVSGFDSASVYGAAAPRTHATNSQSDNRPRRLPQQEISSCDGYVEQMRGKRGKHIYYCFAQE